MEKPANDPGLPSPKLTFPGDRPVPGLSVRAALGVPALAGARVLAGAEGLDRVVHRGNVMEVPDILPWVKPHELLLTTGYPLRNTPRGLPNLVNDLDASGLAAFGVKLHRYLDELPQEMLAAADRVGLPLLLLPDAVGFDDILNQVLTRVLNLQSAELERTWTVHDALLSVVLEGGGLEELAARTAGVLAAPVFVTTAEGRVLAEGGADDGPARWRATSAFDSSGRFRAEREPGRVHTDHDVPGVHAVAPVVAGRVDHGRIVTFTDARELGDADVAVLEQAATVAALVVTKQLAVSAVEGKYRSDFLRDVLSGREHDSERVVAHCRSLGWDVGRPLLVVVGALDHDPAPVEKARSDGLGLRPAQERFARTWQDVVGRRDPAAPVADFSQEVVTLLGAPVDVRAADLVDAVVAQVAGEGGANRRTFSTGVSRVVREVSGLPAAYDQALRALEVGRRMRGPGTVAHFDALGAFRLLSQIVDPDELRGFVRETLRDLADDTDPELVDLRRTLQVLLDSNLNVAVAARRLHFHYNTLRYRIGKLERMLGPFTADADLRLDLALALRAQQMHVVRRA